VRVEKPERIADRKLAADHHAKWSVRQKQQDAMDALSRTIMGSPEYLQKSREPFNRTGWLRMYGTWRHVPLHAHAQAHSDVTI
jgi:hypothetical protein